jgi:hypothetical protein
MREVSRCLMFIVLALLAVEADFSTPTATAQVYDPTANFVTIVGKLTSALPGNKTGSHTTKSGSTANFRGAPYIVGPTITPTSTVPEAEEHIAVAPSDSSSLVAAISDFSLNCVPPNPLAVVCFNTTKYAVSTNNGTSWTEHFVPLDPMTTFPATSDGQVWQANSDPVVAIDNGGRVYLADLYILNATGTGEGFYVCNATLPSVAFTIQSCVPVATNLAGTNIEDKEWITVDNSSSPHSGNVYVSWSHFTGCVDALVVTDCTSDFIVFSRSTDHGQTWSPLTRISPPVQDGAVQGSQVAVGPDGTIYLAYEAFFTGSQVQHFITKSTDGGLTFVPVQPIQPIFNDVTFTSDYRKNSFPSLAVSPASTQAFIYDVYASQPLGNAFVEVVRSVTPGGFTFTSPVTINDSAVGQHFMPAAAVDPQGTLHVSWFDTRNSPTNADMYDIFGTFSRNSGNTFAPNARVNTTLIDEGGTSFIGDYAGIAAASGFAHPVWTNGGFNNGSLQTSTLQLP